ncbi:C-GCAxxG-C-C family protein [Desulfallas thermosapovorans]|uniref:C_GCAxxG_C_C family probable redox protein n=1 Tax=Desulfallas thermosapovorans DSM 6562 TaxID=1121431 RepID=A0A5S4ZQW5_9FIRM|nr:C-GCAxxG-C-C family protein [Desulfallas thermosapovorans]TYO95166.1 C_GCAxxG_C_C family probable redox protein [Desulfallas thermosapovorans DSM 6562]
MEKDLAIEMRNKAGDNFKIGHNCAEAIFLAFRELVAPDVDPGLVKMFTAFGGGLGHAGCMCGALTASAAMVSLIKGRVGTDMGDRDVCYRLSKELHDRFEQKFGATCCRVLNPHEIDSREHMVNCLKITGNTAKLLTEYLMDKDLLPRGK